MDPITHSVTGWALARMGVSRLAPRAGAVVVVAASVADLDYLSYLGGASAYLTHHRGWSHSLLGAAVLGAAVALAFWRRLPQRRAEPQLLARLLVAGWLGAVSHCLLDWSTAYGAQLLWPVRGTWYGLDWFPFVDPWLLFFLLLGIGLPALFGLISEEIGARRSPRGARWGAGLALAACALLVAGRANLHADAIGRLDSRLYQDRSPIRAGAFPASLTPLRWRGVVETDTTYEAVELTLLGSEPRLRALSTYYKPAAAPALNAALATRTARRFLAWARFPHATLTPAGTGWELEMRDLRFAQGSASFRAWIELDGRLQVTREEVRFTGARGGEP